MEKRKRPYHLLIGLTISTIVLFSIYENYWILGSGLGIVLLALIIHPLAILIDTFLSTIAKFIGKIISAITLAVIFIVLFCPIALLSRLTSKNRPIVIKKPTKSNFKEVNKKMFADSMLNPW